MKELEMIFDFLLPPFIPPHSNKSEYIYIVDIIDAFLSFYFSFLGFLHKNLTSSEDGK